MEYVKDLGWQKYKFGEVEDTYEREDNRNDNSWLVGN